MSLPTETPAYKELQADVNATKKLLFSERDKVIDFEIEYPNKEKKTLHFRRLRTSEWEHVTDAIHKVGLMDEAAFKTATKEQLAELNLCYCLALGYASADGLNAQDWKDLDDYYLTQVCFFKLMDVSGVGKDSLESLRWFHQQRGGTDEDGGVQNNGPIPI